jgi:hypothetical protein
LRAFEERRIRGGNREALGGRDLEHGEPALIADHGEKYEY